MQYTRVRLCLLVFSFVFNLRRERGGEGRGGEA